MLDFIRNHILLLDELDRKVLSSFIHSKEDLTGRSMILNAEILSLKKMRWFSYEFLRSWFLRIGKTFGTLGALELKELYYCKHIEIMNSEILQVIMPLDQFQSLS